MLYPVELAVNQRRQLYLFGNHQLHDEVQVFVRDVVVADVFDPLAD